MKYINTAPIFVLLGLILLTACGASTEAMTPIASTTVHPPTLVSHTPKTFPSTTLEETANAQPSFTVTPVAQVSTPTPVSCSPTSSDALGPFYTPGAPVRDKVGIGYLLSGVVRSAVDCSPIPNAQIELWMAGPDGEYRDEYRATFFANNSGAYAFESHFPPPYTGRPPHHHLLVSADGYQTLVTQHYPAAGQAGATFDLVLLPSR